MRKRWDEWWTARWEPVPRKRQQARWNTTGVGETVRTSAIVIFALPPKKGFASASKGSISFLSAATIYFPFSSLTCSSSVCITPIISGCTFEKYVSTKKPILARWKGACGDSWLAGRRCEGKLSARNCDTMPDSMRVSSMMSLLYLIEGTRPRFGRGLD